MVSEPNSIIVFATSEQGTLAALQEAALIRGARIVVLVPYIVGHGHKLAVPSSDADRLAASYRDLASRVGLQVETRVAACREPKHVPGRLLLTASRILVGGQRRTWLATDEQQLARELAGQGHDVTFVDLDTGRPQARATAHA